MSVSSYMVLMVHVTLNVTWPDSQRFTSMGVNIVDLTTETMTENGTDYISTTGGG